MRLALHRGYITSPASLLHAAFSKVHEHATPTPLDWRHLEFRVFSLQRSLHRLLRRRHQRKGLALPGRRLDAVDELSVPRNVLRSAAVRAVQRYAPLVQALLARHAPEAAIIHLDVLVSHLHAFLARLAVMLRFNVISLQFLSADYS